MSDDVQARLARLTEALKHVLTQYVALGRVNQATVEEAARALAEGEEAALTHHNPALIELAERELDILRGAVRAARNEGLYGQLDSTYDDRASRAELDALSRKLGFAEDSEVFQ